MSMYYFTAVVSPLIKLMDKDTGEMLNEYVLIYRAIVVMII